MIKFFPLFYIFAILLILNTSVNGAQCEKKIGNCNENSNSKCEASKNGNGICEKLSPNDIGTCKCLYECDDNGNENSSGKNKKCNGGIGLCGEQCDESCCERNCAIKYPGPLGGSGFCMNIVGAPAPYECICYFNC
ncbi:defensin-like protein 183 [Gossypium australe]|uniref:Defensin-like protein n=1 Tax=Gossypium australe TaxID=47621 RepID=A0A5B6VQZ8_9ROSI|nr:defensin-like protein 183 [Gossypium australe]